MSDADWSGSCARIDILNTVQIVGGSTVMVCHGLVRKGYSS